jgi:hypothetical protein
LFAGQLDDQQMWQHILQFGRIDVAPERDRSASAPLVPIGTEAAEQRKLESLWYFRHNFELSGVLQGYRTDVCSVG